MNILPRIKDSGPGAFRSQPALFMDLLICDFRKLGNCASKNSYEYTEEEVESIFEELDRQIHLLREKFKGKKQFSLRTGPEDT